MKTSYKDELLQQLMQVFIQLQNHLISCSQHMQIRIAVVVLRRKLNMRTSCLCRYVCHLLEVSRDWYICIYA